jgi:hypothetical protein
MTQLNMMYFASVMSRHRLGRYKIQMAVAFATVGVGVAGAGCVGAATPSVRSHDSTNGANVHHQRAPTSFRCPPRSLAMKRLPAPSVPAGKLVGERVHELLLCRYPLRPHHPIVDRYVRARSLVVRITSGLNSLPARPKGAIHCPAITSGDILILAKESGHPIEEVRVALSGCRSATNGSILRWGATGGVRTSQLFALLEHLTGGRSRPE